MVPRTSLPPQLGEGLHRPFSNQCTLQFIENGPDLRHRPAVRSGKVDVLGDSDESDLAGPKSLQECDLLGRISTQPVHPNHHHSVCFRPPCLQELGHLLTTRAIGEKLRTADAFVSDDYGQLGALGLRPGCDPGFLGIERHALRGLLLG